MQADDIFFLKGAIDVSSLQISPLRLARRYVLLLQVRFDLHHVAGDRQLCLLVIPLLDQLLDWVDARHACSPKHPCGFALRQSRAHFVARHETQPREL